MTAQAAWRGGGTAATTIPNWLADLHDAQARIAGSAPRTPM